MRLKSLRIKNFRSFRDETIVFNDYTVFVGPNGVGKSTVLAALNVLFREREHASTDTTWLDEQDFHQGNVSEPVEIIATFEDLSDKAERDLNHYVRQGQLIVAAVAAYDENTKKAEVRQYGERLGLRDFAPFFKAQGEGAKVAELKEIYAQIRELRPDVPTAGTGSAMTEALLRYEAERADECVPLRSADNFYGARKGTLDPYIQWVYVPAVKDARAEQIEGKNTALGKLLARTVRAKANFDIEVERLRAEAAAAYSRLLEEHQGTLAGISDSLLGRLREWAHQDANIKLVWAQDAERSIRVEPPTAKAIAGEAGFQGDVARLGHGLQRSFILAVLHELAQTGDEEIPTLLLGVEEPELYQHPPQARHLANVLHKVAEGNSQVLVTTHSPYFASGLHFENVRMFKRSDTGEVSHSSASLTAVATKLAEITGEEKLPPQGIRAKIHQILLWSLSEMFFANRVVFVEGVEDVAYLTYYLHANDWLDELRARGLAIVPCASKSGMIQACAIASCLNIPYFAIWDADGHETHAERRRKHRADNISLLKFCGVESEPFPDADQFLDRCVIWENEIRQRVKLDVGASWPEIAEAAHNSCGHAPNIGKNSVYISEVIAECMERGIRLEGLDRAARAIRLFAGL